CVAYRGIRTVAAAGSNGYPTGTLARGCRGVQGVPHVVHGRRYPGEKHELPGRLSEEQIEARGDPAPGRGGRRGQRGGPRIVDGVEEYRRRLPPYGEVVGDAAGHGGDHQFGAAAPRAAATGATWSATCSATALSGMVSDSPAHSGPSATTSSASSASAHSTAVYRQPASPAAAYPALWMTGDSECAIGLPSTAARR